MTEHLRSELDGSVLTLTIDRPEAKNAMHGALRAALRKACAEADRDDHISAVILTGTDPVFSAGVDFKQLQRGPDETGNPLDPTPAAMIRAMGTPVICAVNGACVSGALEVALSCSFIVASERARFADTHALLGVVPTWGMTALLPRAVGVRWAREMSITGSYVEAAEALRIGLVNHVVPHDELLPFAVALARRIPRHGVVSDLLRLYQQGQDTTLAGALAQEIQRSVGRTYDLAAFTEAGRSISR
jgi:enoyl-CoA hydratase